MVAHGVGPTVPVVRFAAYRNAVRMSVSANPCDIEPFFAAQDPSLDAVRRELMAGCMAVHGMWFVFRQVDGSGISPTARRYAIRSLAEQ